MKKNRPFLKWAGNKYRCLEQLLPRLPAKKRLIEPFAGSAAVFLNTDYPAYLLAEENQDLISLFNILKADGEAFIDACEPYFLADQNVQLNYNQRRDQFNQCPISNERARIFLYLNRHGYNGLCRYNQKGQFNVPFGRFKRSYFPRKEMAYFHEKSQQATFLHADFRTTFAHAEIGDVIYCDPPYVPLSTTTGFSGYTNKGFTEEDQLALVALAKEYAARGIPVIISNHDTDFIRHHYQGAQIITFPVQRFISCNANKRLPVQEVIALFGG